MTTMMNEMTSSVLAMATQGDASSAWPQLMMFAVVIGIFYFVILLPMKRRQKKETAFRDSLKVNDRVITTSGIYGQIVKLSDRSVQLQIADKVRIEVAKAAIGGYQGQEPVVTENPPQ